MYNLFSDPPRKLAGQIVIPRFKDVASRIKEDVDKVVRYFRQGTFFSRTDHLLVKLISASEISFFHPIDLYYRIAVAKTIPLSNLCRLTTSVSAGRWFDGVFFYGCDELVLGYAEAHDPQQLADNWENIAAVRVLEHPVSHLKYLLPDGNQNNTETGLAVIGVDIPALLIQYRCYVLRHGTDLNSDEAQQRSIRSFVGKYVIPNMLWSQTDLVLFNRVMNSFYDQPDGQALRRLPFHISDYSALLNRGVEEVLDRVTALKMRYRDLLEQLPRLYSAFPLQMPDIAETRQIYWALFLTRLRAIGFLYDVAGEEGRHFNRELLNALKVDLKDFKSENIYRSVLPVSLSDDVNYELKRLFSGL